MATTAVRPAVSIAPAVKGYSVTPGGTTSYGPCIGTYGMGAVYQCCPGDEAQGSSTFTFHAGPATYAEARADRQARGVDIASIHSAEENADAFALTNRRDTWIGINDMQTEGTWVWSDGSTVGYTNWAPGEPNSYEGDEDCAIFWSGGEYWKWYDAYGGQNCNARLAYLCRDTRPRPPPPSS